MFERGLFMKLKSMFTTISLFTILLTGCSDYTETSSSTNYNSSTSSTIQPNKIIDLNFSHEMEYENLVDISPQDKNKIFIGVYYRLTIRWTITSETIGNLPVGGLEDTTMRVCFGNSQTLASSNRNVLDGYALGGGTLEFITSTGSPNCFDTVFVLNSRSGTDNLNNLWFRVFADSLIGANEVQPVSFRITPRSSSEYQIRINGDKDPQTQGGRYIINFLLAPGTYSDFLVEEIFTGEFKTIKIYIPSSTTKIGIKAYKPDNPGIIYIPEIIYDENHVRPDVVSAFQSENQRYFEENIFLLLAAEVGGNSFALEIDATFEIKAFESPNYSARVRTISYNPQAGI